MGRRQDSFYLYLRKKALRRRWPNDMKGGRGENHDNTNSSPSKPIAGGERLDFSKTTRGGKMKKTTYRILAPSTAEWLIKNCKKERKQSQQV